MGLASQRENLGRQLVLVEACISRPSCPPGCWHGCPLAGFGRKQDKPHPTSDKKTHMHFYSVQKNILHIFLAIKNYVYNSMSYHVILISREIGKKY